MRKTWLSNDLKWSRSPTTNSRPGAVTASDQSSPIGGDLPATSCNPLMASCKLVRYQVLSYCAPVPLRWSTMPETEWLDRPQVFSQQLPGCGARVQVE